MFHKIVVHHVAGCNYSLTPGFHIFVSSSVLQNFLSIDLDDCAWFPYSRLQCRDRLCRRMFCQAIATIIWKHSCDCLKRSLRPFSTSADSVARPSDGLSGHEQLEIQAESERSLANAQPVLEVKSSSTFS